MTKVDHGMVLYKIWHFLLIFLQWLTLQWMFPINDCGACFTYIPSVNRYYKVVTHNLDWSAAGSECRSLHQDAHLVVINDEQEQTAVAGMLESMSSESALTGCFEADADYGMMFWTAGQRKRLTGFFGPPFLWRVTSDGGDTEYSMTYTNWQTDQPDFLDRNEFCMEISAGHSYRWNDHPCSSEMCFVCELDM